MEILSTKGVMFPNGLPKVVGAQAQSAFQMRTDHPLHMHPQGQPNRASAAQDFSTLLQSAIDGVEQVDRSSKSLTARAVYDPESVEVHQVLLAAEKARFTLNFAKVLADGLVRGFKELSSPR